MANYLAEAFKAFDALEEDIFEISDSGIEQLDGFLDDSSAFDKEAVEIFDLEAEDEEELRDSYVGEAILDCCVCHEKLFKKKEDIVIDEDSRVVNAGEECPYCFSVDGFKVLGEVAPFQPKKEKEEVEVEETEEIKEERPLEEDTIKQNGKWVNRGEEGTHGTFETKEEADAQRKAMFAKGFKEALRKKREARLAETLGSDIDEYQKWVDYDMKRYHKISDKTNEEVKKAGLQIVKDKYGDYQVIAGNYTESLEEISVKTEDSEVAVKTGDDGKVIVTAEPKEGCCDEDKVEIIKPLSSEEEKEIEEESDDIEDIDEIMFDELEESFLKKVYSNVDSYKTASIKNKDGKFFIEGIIKFNSGKTKKASFIFESAGKTPRNKYKLIGESVQITPKKNAFKILGSKAGNKFVAESMNYDYRAKNLEESLRVNGRVAVKLGE